jgi:HEAT repeat protein
MKSQSMSMTDKLIAAALLSLLWLAPAGAAVPADLRAAVEALLVGYEPADPAPALRRIGPQAAEALVQIAVDPAVSPLRRLRAIEALRHVPTPAGLAFLRRLVDQHRGSEESLAVFELAAAARALGGFGAEALPDLLPLLDHPGADVREGAVAALSQVRAPEAARALGRRLAVERDPGVRSHLQATLKLVKKGR